MAIVSRRAPPRCAVTTIMPAPGGPSSTSRHSSGVKSAFPVMPPSSHPSLRRPRLGQSRPVRPEGRGAGPGEVHPVARWRHGRRTERPVTIRPQELRNATGGGTRIATEEADARPLFVIAHNPQVDTALPFLLRIPLEGGLVLKARDTWPRSSRIYCHRFEEDWPEEPEVIEAVPVTLCRRRGAAIDLVLDRPRLARSQFVFAEVKGRPAIFWQTQRTARTANPGGRVPRRRALTSGFTIVVDTRERYGYRFAGRDVQVERAALPAGDYAVQNQDGV